MLDRLLNLRRCDPVVPALMKSLHATAASMTPRSLEEPFAALTGRERRLLGRWVEQRGVECKPLQYILGSVPFAGVEVAVRRPVLIPRWETEEWVVRVCDALLERKEERLRVLDLCTGSGCVALAVARAFREKKTKVEVTGVDISAACVRLARVNARRNNLEHSTRFILADLTTLTPDDIGGPVDVILTNPPYIDDKGMRDLDPSVSEWEDDVALRGGGGDGLALPRVILEKARGLLKRRETGEEGMPSIVMELGDWAQVETVMGWMKEVGIGMVEGWKDGAGRGRVAVGYRFMWR
ncbi:hypothetical protein HK101_011091 [Irineochytrium annulatum]|nr:hypothetical protein HK101_011091 [Irineochytrium annulatum]